jgi:hypothetical protein
MALEQFSNGAQTTLNGTIASNVSSLIVTSAALFPTTGNFRILIDSELMLVTGVSGTTFTVTRSIEGTVPSIHQNGAPVTEVLTAGGLAQTIADNLNGFPLIILPPGCDLQSTAIMSSAGAAFLCVMNVPSPMWVYKLGFQVTTGNSGTVQWGLFDFHVDPAQAVKLAGGTGALASTGYQTIAAAGGPIKIKQGGYALIVLNPASNFPAWRRTAWASANVIPVAKFYTAGGYVWTDTPDLTTGWTIDSVASNFVLHGGLSGLTAW